MAVAKIYPEAKKTGRGKKSPVPGSFPDIATQRLSEARTVLKFAPDIAIKRKILPLNGEASARNLRPI